MPLARIVGTILRALSAIWFIFALLRVVAGLTGFTRTTDIALGLLSLVIAIATFKFGTWLKHRPKMQPVAKQIALARSRWWKADMGFRLSVFSGVVWAVGAFFFQDSYDRDLYVVLGPPIALLAVYFGYRRFVVGTTNPIALVAAPGTSGQSSAHETSRVSASQAPGEHVIGNAEPAARHDSENDRESARTKPQRDRHASSSSAVVVAWAAGALALFFGIAFLTFRTSERPGPSEETAVVRQQDDDVIVEPGHLRGSKIPEPDTGAAALSEYINSRFGFRVRYPNGVLFPQGESANGDGQVFTSADSAFVLTAWAERRVDESSIEELFAYESRGHVEPHPTLVVTYKRRKGNWFVVSGNEGAVGVYRRVQVGSDHIARLEMRWPANETSRWRSTIERVNLAVRKSP